MKTTIIFTTIFILLISYTSADILSFNAGGDTNLIINSNPFIENMFFPYSQAPTEAASAPAEEVVVPGGTGVNGVRGPYELHIKTQYNKYEKNTLVNVTITIINSGDFAEEEIPFTYYLLSPSETVYDISQETIMTVSLGETTLTKTLTLPVESELGEWKAYGLYGPEDNPLMVAYDSFEVVESLAKENLFKVVILVTIILVAMFVTINRTRKNKKKPKTEESEEYQDEQHNV